MAFDFQDKVVLLTGAAGDLGAALVRGFGGSGAEMALLDRRKGRLKARYAHLASQGTHLFIDDVDLRHEEHAQAAVGHIIERYGRIDVLVNAAGAYRAGKALYETHLETWEAMLGANARSVFLMCRAVLPSVLARASGKVVNIGARPGLQGVARAAAYSASKAAVLRITESLAAEVKGSGINVNAVLPGTMDTAANRDAMPDARRDHWVAPGAVAEVIIFLASDAAQAVHGAAIPAYGRN